MKKKVALICVIAISLLILAGCEDIPFLSSDNGAADATVTKTQAEDIALEHAGFARADIIRIHTEYDRDRINHYDVEFHKDGFEYSYEISADDGKILQAEKEWDD